MKDDLLERLRAVDPATDERVVREARALVDIPGRVTSGEATNVRRFPRALRRRATLVAVAAVVVVAIALPLTLLRSLGDGVGTSRDTPGNWVTVGSLADIQDQGVVYVPTLTAFVIADGANDPYALYAGTTLDGETQGSQADDVVVVTGSRALYCEPSQRFVDPAGNVFDEQGNPLTGSSGVGLLRLALRAVDGDVQIDAPGVTARWAVDVAGDVSDPQGLGCVMTNGVPLEGEPGFGIPLGTKLPPIAVALPQTGSFVQSPITIAGSANVFEATVSIRVLNANGDVIAETFTTAACGTGCRGDFRAEVEVDVPIDTEQPGTIQVFESSAQDGSMINTVEIPVTLVPGLSSGSSNAVEGIWFDHDGSPLPNGSTGSEGNTIAVSAGAEHCGWESATFMHLGWPVGTVATSFDDERQYVRDPRGLFDDGALHVGYLGDATLPEDATDTGIHRGRWHLWVSPSEADDAVFIVNDESGIVERWGRATPLILCA